MVNEANNMVMFLFYNQKKAKIGNCVSFIVGKWKNNKHSIVCSSVASEEAVQLGRTMVTVFAAFEHFPGDIWLHFISPFYFYFYFFYCSYSCCYIIKRYRLYLLENVGNAQRNGRAPTSPHLP